MQRYYITSQGELGGVYTGGEEGALPFTADFCENGDGGLTLLRWPRLARPAVLPERIGGRVLTAIAATAFAPEHLAEELFGQMYGSVVGYSMFCMKMGRCLSAESCEEGGPVSVRIPQSVGRIGGYAFWKCRNLKEIRLPDSVRVLLAGTFGECVGLEEVILPKKLERIGYMPRKGQQVMPDVGVFAGCHCLKEMELPENLVMLGAQTFNSAGLVHLTVKGRQGAEWEREIQVDETAFSHTASLLWMDKAAGDGRVWYRIGLPVAMDKILPGDRKFGGIKKIPFHFFTKPAAYFDQLAQSAFRLDFSARMALARLAFDEGLSGGDREWYMNLLVDYYGYAKQFMPSSGDAFWELFCFLKERRELTAMQVSRLLRTAGEQRLPAELISCMMEVRNQRFGTVTGFEELELEGL